MPKLDVIQEVQLRTQLQNLIHQHRDLDTGEPAAPEDVRHEPDRNRGHGQHAGEEEDATARRIAGGIDNLDGQRGVKGFAHSCQGVLSRLVRIPEEEAEEPQEESPS